MASDYRSLFSDFGQWLEDVFENEFSEETSALCISISEVSDGEYSIDLYSCDSFDEDDTSWISDEDCKVNTSSFVFYTDAEDAVSEFSDLINEYLDDDRFEDYFSSLDALVFADFDGEIELLIKN